MREPFRGQTVEPVYFKVPYACHWCLVFHLLFTKYLGGDLVWEVSGGEMEAFLTVDFRCSFYTRQPNK